MAVAVAGQGGEDVTGAKGRASQVASKFTPNLSGSVTPRNATASQVHPTNPAPYGATDAVKSLRVVQDGAGSGAVGSGRGSAQALPPAAPVEARVSIRERAVWGMTAGALLLLGGVASGSALAVACGFVAVGIFGLTALVAK